MPIDFVPLTDQLKPSKKDPTPLEDRFAKIKAIDKRSDLNKRGMSAGITMDEFAKRLSKFRTGALKWGSARMEALFVEKLNQRFPDLTVNGRRITSSQDFCELIKLGPWDKTLKQMVAYAQHGMWGDGNQDAINLEQAFCKMMRIEFSGFLSNGQPPRKMHKGHCLAQLFVKVKGMILGKIRNTCKKRYREAVYTRKEDPKTHELKFQIIAEEKEEGFHGKLGIFVGSPREFEQVTTKTSPCPPVNSNSEASPAQTLTAAKETLDAGSPKSPFELWMAEHKFTSKADLLRHLLSEPAAPLTEEPMMLTDDEASHQNTRKRSVGKAFGNQLVSLGIDRDTMQLLLL